MKAAEQVRIEAICSRSRHTACKKVLTSFILVFRGRGLSFAGSLSSVSSMEHHGRGRYLVSSSHGQIFSICNYEPEAAGILSMLESILAKHPATQPVVGLSHRMLRCRNSKGECAIASFTQEDRSLQVCGHPSPCLRGIAAAQNQLAIHRYRCVKTDSKARHREGAGWHCCACVVVAANCLPPRKFVVQWRTRGSSLMATCYLNTCTCLKKPRQKLQRIWKGRQAGH